MRIATVAWLVGLQLGCSLSTSLDDLGRAPASNPVEASTGRAIVTVDVVGTGKGTVRSVPSGVDCGATCSAAFAIGTELTLIATPDLGSRFVGFTESCSGTAPCAFTVRGPTLIRATFETIPKVVTWDKSWSGSGLSFADLDLSVSSLTPDTRNVRTTLGRSSGRWYWEIRVTSGASSVNGGGVGLATSDMPAGTPYIGADPSGLSFGYSGFPQYFLQWAGAWVNGAPPPSSALQAGAVYMFALDLDAGHLWLGENGGWFGGGDPAAGKLPTATGLAGTVYPAATLYGNSPHALLANFGASAFTYPVPAGFAPGFF